MGKQMALLLQYKDAKNAIQTKVRSKNKKKFNKIMMRRGESPPLQKQPQTMMINEAGLYELIFRSHMPVAEQFQDWVFEKLLPSIRNKHQSELLREKDDKIDKLEKKLAEFREENRRMFAESKRQMANDHDNQMRHITEEHRKQMKHITKEHRKTRKDTKRVIKTRATVKKPDPSLTPIFKLLKVFPRDYPRVANVPHHFYYVIRTQQRQVSTSMTNVKQKYGERIIVVRETNDANAILMNHCFKQNCTRANEWIKYDNTHNAFTTRSWNDNDLNRVISDLIQTKHTVRGRSYE